MATGGMIRVAVVGLGSIGRRHARLLSERDDVALTICDTVDEFRAETRTTLQRPAAEVPDLAAALDAGQDAVVIATPNHLHVPMGVEAIAAGADLIAEKPLAERPDEARRLVAAARGAGRFLQVGYMLRYDRGLRLLADWVRAGDLGGIVGGRAMIGTYVTLLNARSPYRLEQPNALAVDYTHEIDFIRWIFGDVVGVTAAAATNGNLELRPEPNLLQMILRTVTGALVQVHMDYVQFPQRRILEVYGDRGTASYDFMTGEIRRFVSGREHRWTSHDIAPTTDRIDELFRLQRDSFLDHRCRGVEPIVTGEDGVRALEVAEAAVNAAATGAWIDLPPAGMPARVTRGSAGRASRAASPT